MKQATTPTIPVRLPRWLPVSDLTDARLTLRQNGTLIKCAALADLDVDVNRNVLSLTLTQAETLALSTVYPLEAQLKAYYHGAVFGSQIRSYDVAEILCRDHLF